MTRISGGETPYKPGRIHAAPRAVRALQERDGPRVKDRKPFACATCGEPFRSPIALRLHEEERHAGR